jgi:hypothetical protein
MPQDEGANAILFAHSGQVYVMTPHGVEALKISADEPDLILYEFCPPILVADMVWPKG